MTDQSDEVNELSNLIRTIDGDHTLGAGELAEAIVKSQWMTDIIVKSCREGFKAGLIRGRAEGRSEASGIYG